MTDEEFVAWLRVQPVEMLFTQEQRKRVFTLAGNGTLAGPHDWPLYPSPRVYADCIEELMLERVIEQLS